MKRKQVYDFIKKIIRRRVKICTNFSGDGLMQMLHQWQGRDTRIDLAYVFSRKIMVTMEFIRQNMLK